MQRAITKDLSNLRPPKNDRQWQPRRRGFDDDQFYGNTPPPMNFPSIPAAMGPEVRATVKWFNAEKGYGFAALSDGSGDVFLHINALQSAGYKNVSPGATLSVRVGNGQKGRQIDQVVTVDESTAEAPGARPRSGGFGDRPDRGPRPSGPRRPVDLSNAQEMTGKVKWYNPDKGFGFVTPDSGGKDVFVHATALERAGLTGLAEGQAVRMSVIQGMKGPEAGAINVD